MSPGEIAHVMVAAGTGLLALATFLLVRESQRATRITFGAAHVGRVDAQIKLIEELLNAAHDVYRGNKFPESPSLSERICLVQNQVKAVFENSPFTKSRSAQDWLGEFFAFRRTERLGDARDRLDSLKDKSLPGLNKIRERLQNWVDEAEK